MLSLFKFAFSTLLALGAIDGGREAGAEFRFHARRAYEAVVMESCRPNPDLARATVLAPEIASLRAYEDAMSATEAGRQLALIRGEAAYRRREGGFGCWNDEDPHFAQRHVEMARASFAGHLAAMQGLHSALPDGPSDVLPPAVSAEFRALAGPLVALTRPQACRLSARASDAFITEPARREIEALRRRLAGTAYALHWDMAAADGAFLDSVTMVECSEPLAGSPQVLRDGLQQETRTGIAEIEAKFPLG